MCTDVFMVMKMRLERVISENRTYKSTVVGELSNKDKELFSFFYEK